MSKERQTLALRGGQNRHQPGAARGLRGPLAPILPAPAASSAGYALLAATLLLHACASPTVAPPPVTVPAVVKPQAQAAAAKRQQTVKQLLARAESAQRRGALTRPAGDSAYDYYRRVQQLDPGNRQASSGIQSLVLQLIERARTALRQRDFKRVSRLLQSSEQLAPGNALSAELRTQLQRERASAAASLPGAQAVPLGAAELSAKSTQIRALLAAVAQRIRSHRLRVVIVARNDAEGRWIYSQLRNAVPGYRVRGNIKLGSAPQLLLLAP